jgi:NlpC/P60 family putative phage cell wall peptidase
MHQQVQQREPVQGPALHTGIRDGAVSPERRVAVVAEALRWLGTPYHHQARLHGVGVDCVHLLCAAFEAAGISGPIDPGHYARDWHMHRSQELYALSERGQEVEQPQPGDVALFKFGRTYSHGGVMVNTDQVVHAYMGSGVILTRLTEAPLATRLVRFWTMKGL